MAAELKAEEEKVFAALRKAKNEQSALKVLRRFDVHPLMRRKVDIQAFAQARGWHSPEWADAPALGIHEPPIISSTGNPADSLEWWLESGRPAAEWPAYSFGLWRINGCTWEQWREECREAWLSIGTGDWHSWEYYAHEAWLKCGKSDVSVSMELVIQWDWQAYCQRCWWGIKQYPPIPDWFRKAWKKRQATAAQRELAGTIPDAGELKPPAPAPQQILEKMMAAKLCVLKPERELKGCVIPEEYWQAKGTSLAVLQKWLADNAPNMDANYFLRNYMKTKNGIAFDDGLRAQKSRNNLQRKRIAKTKKRDRSSANLDREIVKNRDKNVKFQ